MSIKQKIQKALLFSIPLLVLFVFISIATVATVGIDHTNMTLPKDFSINNIGAKEVAYTFKVADKLDGQGRIELVLKNNQIKGTAVGSGISCRRDVDFLTSIEGTVNYLTGDIDVIITGVGDPVDVLVPGKVIFQGPLKGSLQGNKVSLNGKVKIKGGIARYAGFKNEEDILIEIPLLT